MMYVPSQLTVCRFLRRFINFMIALGGTESLDRKQGNKWPGEQALMTFLASRDDDGL